MHELPAKVILELGKIALVSQPEIFFHRAQNQIRLMFIWRRVLAQQRGDARGHFVVPVIVSGRVCHAAAVVLHVVARPNGRVSFVQRQLVRAELAAKQPAFPGEVTLNHRPHPPGVIHIARPEQVTEERIHGHEVHVVVRLREIAVGVQRGFAAREI